MHKVTDRVGLSQYLPAVRDFLSFVIRNGLDTRGHERLDRATARYLLNACYVERLALEHGKLVVFGLEWAFPEEAGNLAFSRNVLKGWARFAVLGEGQPPSWEGATAISTKMEEQGNPESADILEMAGDGYLRSSDWSMVRDTDITVSKDHGVSVLLGVAERGETTKTGTRQGFRVDRPHIARKWEYYKRRSEASGGGRVFRVTTSRFYADWNSACDALGYYPGPPHILRHLGPSFDLFEGYRTRGQVQARGRWTAPSSVERYGKTHIYLRAQEAVPLALRQYGQRRLKALKNRPAKALD